MKVVTGVVGNDIHVVANRLIEISLKERGFTVYNLGVNTYLEEFLDAMLETDADLLPAAVKLFARLRKLEGINDSAIMAEYAKIGKELGATVLRRVYFPTNQSELTPEDKKAIDKLAPTLPNRGLILVIGYASRTGNVDHNRKLSSARATNTAEELNAHKLPGQKVQAAYLGQTNRFSSRVPEKNQICEIWHILPPGN